MAASALLLMAVLPATSQALPAVAVAGEVGTLGAGINLTMEIIPFVNVRVLAQGVGFSDGFNKSGIHYDGHARLFSGGALADFYPLVWGPRLSAGLLDDENRAYVRAQCEDSSGCNVESVNISNSMNAQVDGAIKFNHAAPYAGLGWGNAMIGFPFYVSVDAGVLFQGRPKVELHASGTATVTDLKTLTVKPNDNLGTDPQVQTAVAQEQGVLAGDVKSFQFYPVLMLTMGFRF